MSCLCRRTNTRFQTPRRRRPDPSRLPQRMGLPCLSLLRRAGAVPVHQVAQPVGADSCVCPHNPPPATRGACPPPPAGDTRPETGGAWRGMHLCSASEEHKNRNQWRRSMHLCSASGGHKNRNRWRRSIHLCSASEEHKNPKARDSGAAHCPPRAGVNRR